jgi:hypothetical protein
MAANIAAAPKRNAVMASPAPQRMIADGPAGLHAERTGGACEAPSRGLVSRRLGLVARRQAPARRRGDGRVEGRE